MIISIIDEGIALERKHDTSVYTIEFFINGVYTENLPLSQLTDPNTVQK